MPGSEPFFMFCGRNAWSFFGSADGLPELFDFLRRETAVARFVKITQIEWAEFHALHFLHGVIEGEQRGPQQVATRFAHFDFVPGIAGVRSGGSGRSQEPQPRMCLRANLPLRFVAQFPFHLHPVHLRHARGIFEDAIGKGPIARKQHQPRCVVVEAAHGEHSRKALEQVAQRGPAFGVGHRGDDVGRFVQHVVARLRRQFGHLSRGFHAVAFRIRFRAELAHDDAIDAHLTAANQLLGVAARCNSGARNDFL